MSNSLSCISQGHFLHCDVSNEADETKILLSVVIMCELVCVCVRTRLCVCVCVCVKEGRKEMFHDSHMCYPVCGMVHIKEPLLLIGKSSPCGGSGLPLSLSEWSFTMSLTPYNRK